MSKEVLLKIEDLKVNINNNEILKGLNLEIKPGEIHALMGVNGAGKSTLVKTLAAHYDCEVTGGKVTFKNKDLLEMDVSTRANEGIFMSFQSPVEVPGVNNSYFLRTALNAKRAWLDGVAFSAGQASVVGTRGANAGLIRIGNTWTYDAPFDGAIDELAIFDDG